MSVESKKRRWGKARPRDNVTVINKADLEDTLQKLEEEVKERKSRPIVTSQQSSENLKSTLFTGIDLQQPQLMSNERLIEALRKIKVPIPVYFDGSPSRERLLYLYRTYVLPQPQRSKQQWGRKKRLRGKRRNNGGMVVVDQIGKGEDCWGNDESCEKMEVETTGCDGLAGDNGIITKKRRTMSSDSEDKDLVPPIKKLLIKSPSIESVPPGTPISTNLTPQILDGITKQKIIMVKRSSTNAPSSPPASSRRTDTDEINTNPKPSVSRSKITWP